MNAWFDAETMTRCVHSTVNIGIAVDSDMVCTCLFFDMLMSMSRKRCAVG